MTITPVIKGQLTKARNTTNPKQAVIAVFVKHMPRQQAKHAARKLLAQ